MTVYPENAQAIAAQLGAPVLSSKYEASNNVFSSKPFANYLDLVTVKNESYADKKDNRVKMIVLRLKPTLEVRLPALSKLFESFKGSREYSRQYPHAELLYNTSRTRQYNKRRELIIRPKNPLDTPCSYIGIVYEEENFERYFAERYYTEKIIQDNEYFTWPEMRVDIISFKLLPRRN